MAPRTGCAVDSQREDLSGLPNTRGLLDPSLGFVNYLLSLVGIPAISWLSDAHLVIPAIILVDAWWQTGVITLIILAGLQSLPEEPREIARVPARGRHPYPRSRRAKLTIIAAVAPQIRRSCHRIS